MTMEMYLVIFLLAIHLYWLSIVVDVDRKVLSTGFIILTSISVYAICPSLLKLGLIIQFIFYLAAIISIYYIKSGDK